MSMLEHIRRGGPGWLQGAMTLGGGSAITSLTIGGVYGYEFLWIQPVSMVIGCIMLFAASHQTLSTRVGPFEAMRKHVSAPLAWAWAIAAAGSSVIWGFSHYPLSAGMLEEALRTSTGLQLDGSAREAMLFGLALLVWAVCARTVWVYNDGHSAVKAFETIIKFLSGAIILGFAWVVASASWQGEIAWGHVLAGFVPTSLPQDAAGVTTMMAALGTAVGINMTFVYGYTLLARGWGREERPLARYDTVLGLVLPYILVTSLISIASAGLIHGEPIEAGTRISPAQASGMFVEAGLGPVLGQLVFPLGVLGMAVGSLVMHMLTCGAALGAMFNLEPGSRGYRFACLLPTPAVLGVFLWSTMGPYVILPTSAICGFLLPIAYVGWMALNNRPEYLGADVPTGNRRALFNVCMGLCIATVLASVVYTTSIALGWM